MKYVWYASFAIPKAHEYACPRNGVVATRSEYESPRLSSLNSYFIGLSSINIDVIKSLPAKILTYITGIHFFLELVG